jgi:AraC-like DNA-binding protein
MVMQMPSVPTPVAALPECQFATLSGHGSGSRIALRHGTVVLSELPSGMSEIRALAPSVKYVVEGEEVYRVAGRNHRLGKGEFLLVEAGSDFEVRTARTGPTIGLCVYLGVGGAPSPLSGQDRLGALVLRGSSAHPLAALMERHAQRLLQRRSASEAETRRIIADVTEAATLYLSDFRNGVDRLGSAKLSTRVETLQRLERARGFIHAHRARPLTLDEIASEAALSRFHLTRCFAEAYGVPPLAYHRALRLDAAADRIRCGHASPTQLSEELGYASLSAFTRAFRQKFGMPPSAVRSLVS